MTVSKHIASKHYFLNVCNNFGRNGNGTDVSSCSTTLHLQLELTALTMMSVWEQTLWIEWQLRLILRAISMQVT